MYPHVSSCIFMYPHVSSCIFMYPHVSSCILMYPHVSSNSQTAVFWPRTEMMRDLNVYPTAWMVDNLPLLDERLGKFIVDANRSPWSGTRVATTLRLASYLLHFLKGEQLEWVAAFLDHLCNFRPSYMSLKQFEMIVVNSRFLSQSSRQHKLYICVVSHWKTSLCNSPIAQKDILSLKSPITQVARVVCQAAALINSLDVTTLKTHTRPPKRPRR
jgi:hypothetical protein